MMGLTAKIAIDGVTFAFDKLYSYLIPTELINTISPGCRVTVPFGRGNVKKQGMVFYISEGETEKLKKIICSIDSVPILTEELVKMCEYMHENVFCTYYSAVHSMIPAGLNYKITNYYSANENKQIVLSGAEQEIYNYLIKNGCKKEDFLQKKFNVDNLLIGDMTNKGILLINADPKRQMNNLMQKWVRLLVPEDQISSYKLTERQIEVINFIKDSVNISVKELRYYTGCSTSVINKLVLLNIIEIYEKQVFRKPYSHSIKAEKSKIELTEEQTIAYNGLLNEYEKKEGNISLLYGITGSGKTQVFLKLVDTVSNCGRGIIVMVPEISLTPQLINIFTERYGDKIAVLHSAMSMGQRMDEWQRIRDGKALIAVGTRSAIFAPFQDLGLIIIDEEHEHTYKSESSPRFHARDLAKFRISYSKGLLCLASATPSVESYSAAKTGKYSFFTLTKRYGKAVLPTVETVDMKKEILSGNACCISNYLKDSISEELSKKRQVILLLNRRGHNTYITCPDCGYVASCPNCSISLTYHSANNRLMCHYCGYSVKADNKCPKCGKEHMKYMGIGTQKVESDLKLLFPQSRILRVDADSMSSKDAYSDFLDSFSKGEYDILLGTQMVAKGLNFPNVSLVGVLGADSAMYSEDFRSYEKTFSLLTQVVGRAGRGNVSGRAIIQTINPENNIIELASRQDYDSFFNQEIMTRKLMVYPPYCDICSVYSMSDTQLDAENSIKGIFNQIKDKINSDYKDIKIIILGPSPASVPKVNNKYRWRMIIKFKNCKRFRDMLIASVSSSKTNGSVISIDINPESVL